MTTKYVNVKSLNLREQASTSAKILAELKDGTALEILASTKGWEQVSVKSGRKTLKGFVSSEFLRDTKEVPAIVEPVWLKQARKYVGVKEVPGSKHNPTVVSWWSKIGASFRDDETPWCAGFVGGVFEELGVKSSRSAAARSYSKWGVKLDKPAVGAVVVFWRGSPTSASGHVGFVVGQDANGNLMVLGGNQGDAVTIKPFSKGRIVGYSWPAGAPLPTNYSLPLIGSDGKVSTDES